MSSDEKRTREGPPVTSVMGRTQGPIESEMVADSDEEVLFALGYKQEFKRDFSIWSCFSVFFSALGLLPSIASTLSYDLAYSGPAGSVWGWLVCGIMIQFVALSLAELCSSIPTAGGLYYASAVLAPEGWGPLCSWITGWSNFLGFLSAPCAINYALASMIITAAEIGNPEYSAKTYHVFLVLIGLLILQAALAMNATRIVGRINRFGAFVNCLVIFIFIIWLPAGSINSPKTNPNSVVWTSQGVINGTEWPTGFAFLMGFLTVLWTCGGLDVSFHISEECSNASVACPRILVINAQLGLWLGWAIILVIAYTVQDVQDVVAGQFGQPLGSLCLQVLGPKAGLSLFSLNIVAQFFVGQGVITAMSRLTFAYARDDVLPGSRWLRIVNRYTKTPVNAVWLSSVVGAVLGLLMFASPVAIGAVFSIGAVAQFTAYGFPIMLKTFFVGDKFRPGPWHLGRFSRPIGFISCSFIALMIPILCFPAVKGKDLNALSMNWACLLYGGCMFLSLCWYAIDARKWFKGPKINVEHMIHGRDFESEEHSKKS